MTDSKKINFDNKTAFNLELICSCGGSLTIDKDIWSLQRIAPGFKDYEMLGVYECPKCHGDIYFRYAVNDDRIILQLVDKK